MSLKSQKCRRNLPGWRKNGVFSDMHALKKKRVQVFTRVGRLVNLYSVTRTLLINPFGLEIIFSFFCVNKDLIPKDVAVAWGCRRRPLKTDFHSAIFVVKYRLFYCWNRIVFHFIPLGSSKDKRKRSRARDKKSWMENRLYAGRQWGTRLRVHVSLCHVNKPYKHKHTRTKSVIFILFSKDIATISMYTSSIESQVAS